MFNPVVNISDDFTGISFTFTLSSVSRRSFNIWSIRSGWDRFIKSSFSLLLFICRKSWRPPSIMIFNPVFCTVYFLQPTWSRLCIDRWWCYRLCTRHTTFSVYRIHICPLQTVSIQLHLQACQWGICSTLIQLAFGCTNFSLSVGHNPLYHPHWTSWHHKEFPYIFPFPLVLKKARLTHSQVGLCAHYESQFYEATGAYVWL